MLASELMVPAPYSQGPTRRPTVCAPLGLNPLWLLAVPILLALVVPSWLSGQPAARKATTVSALLAYPVFFHGERVAVRAESWADHESTWLIAGDAKVMTLGEPVPGPGDRVEVRATFWDVGRLNRDDPRLAGFNLGDLSEALFQKPWPSTGELPVLIVESTLPATRLPAASVRTLALEPETYEGEPVTVTGRFRGRNLYGDLPDAPGLGRWEFVLRSADGAIWVTGIRPRGRDFDLDVTARVDTGRWLEVTGVIHVTRDLVRLEGTDVELAQPPAAAAPTAAEAAPRMALPPEVIFSAPTQGDVDIAPDTLVRIQFSRDLDPESFEDQVRIGYHGEESFERGASPPPPIEFDVEYLKRNRVLEIRFTEPLERFRTVEVELLDGITATDGAVLPPWTLTFALGG